MKSQISAGSIGSTEDLRRELLATKLRIQLKENELRARVKQVPGELFYSGVDSFIPSVLSGKVSSFALNAGRGLINNFFVRKAVTAGSYHVINALKPSGVVRRITSGVGSLLKKKKT